MHILTIIKKNKNYLLIGFISLIVHGLLLFNDGIYWDDWLSITTLKDKNWSVIRAAGLERGVPFDSYFIWFFSRFQNIEFAQSLFAFLFILLASVLVYAICNQVGVLTRTDSLWIALIHLVYPAFQTRVLLSTTNYLFYYMLFLGGVFLALKSQDRDSIWRFGLRIGAYCLFLISFSLSSLLVFYFGFLLLFVLYTRQVKAFSKREMLTRFLPRNLDFLLLPFLFWFAKEIIFPRYGLYTNYNQFNFSVKNILTNCFYFLKNSIYGQLIGAFQQLIDVPALTLLWILAILRGVSFLKQSKQINSIKPIHLFLYGVFLLGLGIFPYTVVGLSPSMTGWDTRHSLLVGLPAAILIVATARMVFNRTIAGFSRTGWILIMTLLFAFSLVTISNYLNLQMRWIKDRSVMANLAQMDGANGYSVYRIDDQYPIEGIENNYRFYEWSSIFKEIWGDETRIGFDQHGYIPKQLLDLNKYFSKRYNLSTLKPSGCQAALTILPGSRNGSSLEISAAYFYYKFFQPQELQGFLSNITTLQIDHFDSPDAVDCAG